MLGTVLSILHIKTYSTLNKETPLTQACLVGNSSSLSSSIALATQEALFPHQQEVWQGHVIYFGQLNVGGNNLFHLEVGIFN